MKKVTIEEIKELARERWEGCDGCDENDKYFFMNGFIVGYLNAQVNNIDEVSPINTCEYSGLPAVKSYEK